MKNQFNSEIGCAQQAISETGVKTDSCFAYENRYRILESSQKTPFTAVELFAGAGGMALGLEHAGLQSIMLAELDTHAVATLRANRPDWNVLHTDVSKIDYSGLSADVVVGGFPCQAFSYAGRRLGFEDTRGTLFYEFARCVAEVKPKVIVAENVRGLERHDNGKTLQTMLAVLDELGYRAEYKILRAQYFDVPQKRERLVIIGVPKQSSLKVLFPKEQNYTIGLKEALVDVPASDGQKYPPRKREIMALIPAGGCWRNLPEELQKSYMGASYYSSGGKTGMARRLSWDEPSLTLTCAPAQKQTERCHPSETRPLNVREYARIQTFPDNWEFSGPQGSRYRQIGNAVPVNLAYHIGRCVVAMLSQTCQEPFQGENLAPRGKLSTMP